MSHKFMGSVEDNTLMKGEEINKHPKCGDLNGFDMQKMLLKDKCRP